jgi:hypothetical protein
MYVDNFQGGWAVKGLLEGVIGRGYWVGSGGGGDIARGIQRITRLSVACWHLPHSIDLCGSRTPCTVEPGGNRRPGECISMYNCPHVVCRHHICKDCMGAVAAGC